MATQAAPVISRSVKRFFKHKPITRIHRSLSDYKQQWKTSPRMAALKTALVGAGIVFTVINPLLTIGGAGFVYAMNKQDERNAERITRIKDHARAGTLQQHYPRMDFSSPRAIMTSFSSGARRAAKGAFGKPPSRRMLKFLGGAGVATLCLGPIAPVMLGGMIALDKAHERYQISEAYKDLKKPGAKHKLVDHPPRI